MMNLSHGIKQVEGGWRDLKSIMRMISSLIASIALIVIGYTYDKIWLLLGGIALFILFVVFIVLKVRKTSTRVAKLARI